MNIRKKIILYFSATTIVLTAVVFTLIYSLFSAYREEEFQQRLNDKITFSLKFLSDIQQTNEELLRNMDRITINDLYEEKMLLFDQDKKLIYASLDDTKIAKASEILRRLSPARKWVETKEGKYDVVGAYIQLKDGNFYGIYKAYDTFGYTKMQFLLYVLLGAFAFISLVTILTTRYLSRQISSPVNRMAKEIEALDFDHGNASITIPPTHDEINFLATKFNELMKSLKLSFSFQKHAVHHISHELKTPIAILVSNFEKIEKEDDIDQIRAIVQDQKERTIALSDMINALLEVSKVESGNPSATDQIRIDELFFDVIEQLQSIYPDFVFRMILPEDIMDEESLTLSCNAKLMRIALTNLLINCVRYSSLPQAQIRLIPQSEGLEISIQNPGRVVLEAKRKLLFNYFFRGENGLGIQGFGLGLAMVQKIIDLHAGRIVYEVPEDGINVFRIVLPKKK